GGANQGVAGAFPCIVVIIITLVLQLTSHYPWSVRPAWLTWMAFEAIILTAPLFIIGLIMNGSSSFTAVVPNHDYYAQIVIGIGAGIYEELVFRLVILGLLLMLFDNVLRFGHATSIVTATIISALLFSTHHYFGIDMAGRFVYLEPMDLGSFLFRMAAGVYFAIVFHYRGYGITAGTHAFYNVFYFTFFA
ncbi:MAG: CPBP family intramembrane metalloprotease, partial [Sedimentisphaerales bacterium]|nr:CPBP family intramembrane metalloprotease [Sedimentisphaerales bacterium]